jgi:hypothetical protein
MKWIATLSTAGIVSAMFAGRFTAAKSPLIVHEWGTITTRHAPDGTPRGRLNHVSGADTLPNFVYRYEPDATSRDPNTSLVKTSLVAGRTDVTMRLETPVMYFYAPRGATTVPPFDVDVHFRGGILNEFYPRGDASVALDSDLLDGSSAPGPAGSRWNGAVLDSNVVGRLRWRGVSLRDSVSVRPTTSHVWLAPRRVHAAGVAAISGEAERYLFYRGVAHLDALVQTALSGADVRLRAPKDLGWMREPSMTIPKLWLVEVRTDGSAAYRAHDAITIARSGPSADVGRLGLFARGEFGPGKLDELRASMKRALIAAGLYDDEAEAMLETWGDSYFHHPGLRLFYIVPAAWVNYHLPVEISAPHEMTRVLVGRIDLERDVP